VLSLLHQPKAREWTDGGRERARRPNRRLGSASARLCPTEFFHSDCCGPTMSTTTASAAPRPAQPMSAEKCAALGVGCMLCWPAALRYKFKNARIRCSRRTIGLSILPPTKRQTQMQSALFCSIRNGPQLSVLPSRLP
jgi:hypothetical protein